MTLSCCLPRISEEITQRPRLSAVTKDSLGGWHRWSEDHHELEWGGPGVGSARGRSHRQGTVTSRLAVNTRKPAISTTWSSSAPFPNRPPTSSRRPWTAAQTSSLRPARKPVRPLPQLLARGGSLSRADHHVRRGLRAPALPTARPVTDGAGPRHRRSRHRRTAALRPPKAARPYSPQRSKAPPALKSVMPGSPAS